MTDLDFIATWGRFKPKPALLELCHVEESVSRLTVMLIIEFILDGTGVWLPSNHTTRWQVKTWWLSWKSAINKWWKQHSSNIAILLTPSKLSLLQCFSSKTYTPVGNKNRCRYVISWYMPKAFESNSDSVQRINEEVKCFLGWEDVHRFFNLLHETKLAFLQSYLK